MVKTISHCMAARLRYGGWLCDDIGECNQRKAHCKVCNITLKKGEGIANTLFMVDGYTAGRVHLCVDCNLSIDTGEEYPTSYPRNMYR